MKWNAFGKTQVNCINVNATLKQTFNSAKKHF